ncbi:MAG: hypothetical protein ACYDDF_12675 [Thermoplasmatota archaeon]
MRAVLVILAVLAVPILAILSGATSPPASIPPDGPAGPVETLSAIRAGALHAGSAVTTRAVTVVGVNCPSCESATVPADFYLRDRSGTQVWVHDPTTWQATYNVKKQNFVPEVGMTVVVQGVVGYVDGQYMITLKRFSEAGQPGPTVHAYDVAAGKFATGTFVWLDAVRVLNRGFWDDGDHSWDVRDPAGGGLVHIELSPPYAGQLPLPNMGDVVSPYGEIRYDPDHGWWEIHPVRCWSPNACVAPVSGYVQSGPIAGTPTATGDSTGYYEQGGPVPLWVPMKSGGSGTSDAGSGSSYGGSSGGTVTFSPSGNNWWVQTLVSSPQSVTGVDACVNNDACTSLAHQSWGGWARSFFVATGSSVVFRAQEVNGAIVSSWVCAWPPSGSGSSTTTSTGTGAGTWSTFHPANGNTWWVQTSVTSTKPLAGVDASINSGSWISLTNDGWGWAKSIYAPAGSSVTFRARATDQSTAESAPYRWPA